MKPKEILAITESVAIIAAMIALMIHPQRYASAFGNGLTLFAMNVLPTMFPYLFFTKLLTATGFSNKLSKLLKKPLKFFGLPSCCGFVCVMSALSGYPIGAKMTADLKNEGLNLEQCKALTALSSISGPIFIVGTVGSAIFGSVKIGFIILASNLLAALINGVIWKCRRYIDIPIREKIVSTKLSDVAYDTVMTVLVVGGYVALFNMLADILKDAELIDVVGNLLNAIPFFGDLGLGEGFIYGIAEMTRGCFVLSRQGITQESISLSSALIAFGGGSVIIQSVTFLSEIGVSFPSFIIRKTTQAILAFAICYGLCFIL